MTDGSVLIDSAVPIYALGGDGPYKAGCRALMMRMATKTFRMYASVEMIRELVNHRMRVTGDRRLAAADGRDTSPACTLLFFDREVLDLSLDLIERIPTIRGRDALHAATALTYGIDTIVSPDRAFDGIPGFTRVDPRDFAVG